MNKNIDELLKQALSPVDEPGAGVNERILKRVKEIESMTKKKGKMKSLPMAAAIAVAVFILGSGTAFAAWKYLTPAQVAQKNEMGKLAEAFEGDDAVVINEKQSFEDYTITLLGMTSGKNLSEYAEENGLEENKTYVVTAIERTDGGQMPDTRDEAYGSETFFMSPLIKGLDPNWYNAMTIGGAYQEFVQDGIMYRLIECDNVEIFAGRGLYFCVNAGTFYDQQAYSYDPGTGEITRNEEYDGINALFVLPIDSSKGDEEAAKAYLKQWDRSWESDEDEEIKQSVSDMEVEAFMDKLTSENLDAYAERVEYTIQVLTPDENGNIKYSYEMESGAGGDGILAISEIFGDKEYGVPKITGYSYEEDGLESLIIDVLTLNEDGTITFVIYVPKLAE